MMQTRLKNHHICQNEYHSRTSCGEMLEVLALFLITANRHSRLKDEFF